MLRPGISSDGAARNQNTLSTARVAGLSRTTARMTVGSAFVPAARHRIRFTLLSHSRHPCKPPTPCHWLDRVAVNKREATQLVRLRDFLLPKLISGEVSVTHAGQTAQAAT